METYDQSLTVRQGRVEFFQRFGFSEDAYTANKFAIRVGKIEVVLPNIPSRVVVARFHDIHHVLTGYAADWKGEAEIGAWEIATGCRGYWVAWFFNLGAMIVGFGLWPRATWRAWMRGRRSTTNLYHGFDYTALLDMTIGELGAKIGLAPN